MKRPILERLIPETSGFNRQRIAFASAVVVIALGALTYLLTRESEEPFLRPEPQVTPAASRPPRELLEDPPESSPPILPPALTRPEPLEAQPRISPRVIQAFDAIDPHRRPPKAAPSSGRPRPGALPPELTSIFEDLEQQNQALGKFLEASSSPGLSSPSLDRLGSLISGGPPDNDTARSAAPPATQHLRASVKAPGSRFLLRQGTVIPAQLLSEINSDLPGQVLAHVVSDVRDSLHFKTLLVPRGTKLVGVYRSGLSAGQNRLAVAWTRLLLPDGSAIDVGELPGVDAAGRSGLSDRVNHHTARIFGNALLLSLLSAGFEAAQPSPGDLRLSAGDLALAGASRQLEGAASEILRRSGSIPPTVRIRAGTAFHVFLTGDLSFDRPYRP